MKIAAITSYFPTSKNPFNGQSAYETIKALGEWAEVEVFSPAPKYIAGPASWGPPDLNYVVPGVKCTFVTFPAVPMISRVWNGYSIIKEIGPLIEQGNFDLILSYWVYPDGFAAVKIGKKLGIPVIVKAIGSDLNLVHGVSRWYSKWTMNHADLVLTVSQALADTAIAMGVDPDKVVAVLNGCDPKVFYYREPAMDTECKTVLYVGRLDKRKGLRELIRSAAALDNIYPNLRLMLAGTGPDRAELEDLARRLGVQAEFLGFMPNCKVGGLLAQADVYTLPSYNEGCPNGVIEALACGCPVVSTDVGGIPEIIKPYSGILVQPRSVESLTAGLRGALDRTWDRRLIAESQNRTWNNVAGDIVGAIRSRIPLSKFANHYARQKEPFPIMVKKLSKHIF